MSAVAIIQARMGSTRLPGKVLMDLCGKPVLWHVVQRTQAAQRVHRVLVATTRRAEDDAIKELCREWGTPVYRGPAEDVLARYHGAVRYLDRQGVPVDLIVRITADCPLMDPAVIDRGVREAEEKNPDYISNVDPPTFPDGLDVEVFTRQVLEITHSEARLPSDREHVTPFMRRSGRFKTVNFRAVTDLSHLRWTLDTREDYLFIREVYRHLFPQKNLFALEDVVRLLADHPELSGINSHLKRNEGYRLSLEKDTRILGAE
ncbi:MAG TPA: glycosyltransferase family protein [Methanomicrobiales archaeon]|nr:glycosyltransferase family protein [Methanomicrobiales archaeon]